jgi:hypothetical protein
MLEDWSGSIMMSNGKPLVLLWLGIGLVLVAFILQGFVYSAGMREWFDALFHYPTHVTWEVIFIALIPIIGFVLIFLSAIWLTLIQAASRVPKSNTKTGRIMNLPTFSRGECQL